MGTRFGRRAADGTYEGESTENGKNSTLSVRHAAATFS